MPPGTEKATTCRLFLMSFLVGVGNGKVPPAGASIPEH